MPLLSNNFSKTILTTLFRVYVNGEDIKRKVYRYTYESKNKLHDVDILEKALFTGSKYIKVIYRINGVPYEKPDNIHSAIEEYYELVI